MRAAFTTRIYLHLSSRMLHTRTLWVCRGKRAGPSGDGPAQPLKMYHLAAGAEAIAVFLFVHFIVCRYVDRLARRAAITLRVRLLWRKRMHRSNFVHVGAVGEIIESGQTHIQLAG